MDNKPLLSICILTYNRRQDLEKLLADIVSQFTSEIRKQIEVVVSDNASSDGSEEMVREMQNKNSEICYYRNQENIGFDRNVANALAKARGEFCWTISDKRRLGEGALKYVLDILAEHPEIAFCAIDRDKDRGAIKIFQNGSEQIREELIYGGDMSTCIFKKDYIPQDMEKYYDNFWIHLSLMLEMIAKRPSLVIGNVFAIEKMDSSCRWAQGGQAFFTYISLKNILLNAVKLGYDKATVGKLIGIMANGLPYNVFSARLHGLPITWKNFSILAKGYYQYPGSLFLAIVIFFIPRPILKITKLLKDSYAQ